MTEHLILIVGLFVLVALIGLFFAIREFLKKPDATPPKDSHISDDPNKERDTLFKNWIWLLLALPLASCGSSPKIEPLPVEPAAQLGYDTIYPYNWPVELWTSKRWRRSRGEHVATYTWVFTPVSISNGVHSAFGEWVSKTEFKSKECTYLVTYRSVTQIKNGHQIQSWWLGR